MLQKRHILLATAGASVLTSAMATPASAQTLHEAISGGKVYGDFNLRFEEVSQSNAREDASALTLRTRLGYVSGSINGWSFNVEMEDSRIVLGQGDYSVDPAGYKPGVYSVIADPETTELDQGYIQYKSDKYSVKLGRQVITLDGHRFVGHVGWRQDRQSFDAANFMYHPNDKFSASYAYVTQRNRIFSEAADTDAKDHLFNASYKTSLGKVVAYAYLLEVDNGITNGLDTYGFSFDGKSNVKGLTLSYHLEYATQTSKAVTSEYDADYFAASLGTAIKGLTLSLAYEVLGSDNGAYGFSTPLATMHKFNGWADMFLATPQQGLVDINLSLGSKGLGGNWLLKYHDYSADEASATVDDLGHEINAQYTTVLNKNYALGVKFAKYTGESNRPDTDKIWLWVSTKF